MSGNETWIYQGRQSHGWFGTGTAPTSGSGEAEAQSDELFQPADSSRRIAYAASSIIIHVPREKRGRWLSAVNDAALEKLQKIVPVWHDAWALSRDAFRTHFLDQYTSDEAVDRLRSVAKAIIDAGTHEELAGAGKGLAAVAMHVGIDAWPRFLSNALQRAMEASERSDAARAADAFTIMRPPQSSRLQPATPSAVPEGAQSKMPESRLFYADARNRAYCIERCADLALPTRNYGVAFQRCVATCTGQNLFPEWVPHFP